MSVGAHRQAEQFMAEAELLDSAGLAAEAASRRLQAAKAEARAFPLIPSARLCPYQAAKARVSVRRSSRARGISTMSGLSEDR